MKAKLVIHCLTLSLILPTAVAAQSIEAAAARAATNLAAQSQAPAQNPYKLPALGLMAGGAGLLILGLMQERGVKAEGDIFEDNFTVKETGGSKTALTVLGVVAAGAGAGLWFWGEDKKNRPSISMTPSRIQIGFRF